ncbi:hypothetical protein J8Z86_22315 [Yersinia enterocolitica]|uniref:hypothetical protein n=1 Tax=Yersinia enterocolitica TaxID=630 RepID=UPI001C8D25F5|nr:hypothetical protein [Yersinia enterocolitica]MBX9498769.1 hypothetical protein [Yersinia enterocolitica]
MPELRMHAASFKHGGINLILGHLFIRDKWYQPIGNRVKAVDIAKIEVASEDSVKKIGGSIGWGVVGGALLGPAGLIAGAIIGGNGKDVTFIVELVDGRKFMATTKSKEFKQLQAKNMKF